MSGREFKSRQVHNWYFIFERLRKLFERVVDNIYHSFFILEVMKSKEEIDRLFDIYLEASSSLNIERYLSRQGFEHALNNKGYLAYKPDDEKYSSIGYKLGDEKPEIVCN